MEGRFGRNSVAGALLRLAIALTVALVLTAGIGLASVKAIQDQIADYRQTVTASIDGSGQLQTALTLAQSNFRGYILTDNPAFRQDYETQRTMVMELEEDLASQPDLVVDDLTLQRVSRQSDRWFGITTTLMSRPQSVQEPDLMVANRAYDETMTDYERLRQEVLAVRDVRRDDYQRLMTLGQIAILVVGLLSLAVVVASTRLLGNRLHQPLSALGDVVSRHQRGDTAARAEVDRGTAEVQAVSAAFNRLADASDVAEGHIRQDMQMARIVSVVSNILAASVTDAKHWDNACAELCRRFDLDGAVIIADSAQPPMAPLGHWGRDGRSGTEVFPDGITEDATLQGLAGRGLILAATPAEIRAQLGPEAADILERHKVQSCALAVLSESDRVVGVLALVANRHRVWQEHEVSTIIQVGANTAQFLVQREVIGRLHELDQQKSDFMATTSHELRTPLTSISGYLEMLEDGDLGELSSPQHSAVTVLGRNVARLRGLIEDLLILNRLDSGKGRAVNEEVDVHRSLVDIIQSLDPVAAKKSVELIGPDVSGDDMDAAADRQEAPFRTMGDRSQLERALMNVVSNAVKFTPTHGHVTIALATQDSHVEFVCQDSGIGIPEKDMKNLSDRFFRASNAIEQQVPGSGLGLSIVRAIVEGHQGTMKIGSVEGEGTRVAITLPLAAASDGIAPSLLVE